MLLRNRRGTGERGATAVEFAIVVPLLLLILLGLVDFGRLFYVQISLNAASREGARASSLSESAADVTSIVQASSPGAAQLGFPGSTDLSVVQTPCDPAAKGELTSVTVSTNFRFFTPVGLIKWYDSSSTGGDDMQLHSTSEMLCVG